MSTEWAVLKRDDLRAMGLSRRSLEQRISRGQLQRVGRSVYLEGPRLTGLQGWCQDVAVAVASWPDGLVTGQSAAGLYGLDGFDPPVPLAMQVPPGASGRGQGLRRWQSLEPPERVQEIWCTSPAETLLGLAADLAPRPGCTAASRKLPPADLVELATESALRRGLVSLASLREVIESAHRRRGLPSLVEVLDRRPDQPPTESYLETRFVQVVRDAGLADFDRQVELSDEHGVIGRVDFQAGAIVVELVGRRWHLDRFDPDHRRYARLTAAGQLLLPFTFNQVEHHSEDVVATLLAALDRPARPDNRFGG